MRPIPEFKNEYKVPDKAPARGGYITMERAYELITPLFGGGVEPGAADPVTVIRATEIRGHLRFWWRATRGGQFDGDLRRMKEVENVIFGAAGSGDTCKESAVAVRVITKSSGQAFSKDRNGKHIYDPQGEYGYAAFTLRPSGEKQMIAPEFRRDVRFDLKIWYPKKIEIKNGAQLIQLDSEKEIEAAFWAWETFGGVGARTRRGFGSIKLLQVDGKPIAYPKDSGEAKKQIDKKLSEYQSDENFPDDLPQMRHFQIYGEEKKPEQIHLDLINLLRGFRQDRGGNKFGRSRWPEADEIRRLTNSGSQTKSNVSSFPRAYLGLPIMFEFASEKGRVPKAILQLLKGTRLSSPLLFRPYPIGADKAVGLIAELDGTLGIVEDGLILLERNRMHYVNAGVPDALVDHVAPLRGKNHTIDAFFEYVKQSSNKKGRK